MATLMHADPLLAALEAFTSISRSEVLPTRTMMLWRRQSPVRTSQLGIQETPVTRASWSLSESKTMKACCP